MKIKYLLPIFALLFICSCAEDPLPEEEEMEMEMEEEVITICDTDRYTLPIFTEIDSLTNVTFAESNMDTGHPNDLLMDIYMPAEGTDTLTKRPVLIWAFGGAFITGERSQMAEIARQSARLGYVSATIDYRILPFSFVIPDSTKMMDIAVKASSDMKAAIRHFVMDADTNNEYEIDPNQIFIGGLSAGSLTALLTGLVDESDIDTEFLQNLISDNGGIHGNTGSTENQAYDYDVAGIVNLSGAVYQLDFIDSEDPPIFSVHGDADIVVPYVFGMPDLGFAQIDFSIYGSKSIFDRAEEVGLRNDLVTINGGDHTGIYIDDEFAQTREDFFALGYQFLKDEICK